MRLNSIHGPPIVIVDGPRDRPGQTAHFPIRIGASTIVNRAELDASTRFQVCSPVTLLAAIAITGQANEQAVGSNAETLSVLLLAIAEGRASDRIAANAALQI